MKKQKKEVNNKFRGKHLHIKMKIIQIFQEIITN